MRTALRAVADGARRVGGQAAPGRLDRRAEHAVGVGHADARERPDVLGPYHLVWPRDFYHVATAQKAAGDDAAATRLLDFLWRVQKPDGSWWQNTRVDGTPYWTSLQLDEVALPVVLAWWLEPHAAPTTGSTSSAAADFIVANGPETEQERWENQSGWSPNTIATEIAALICAADVARAQRRRARGRRRTRRRRTSGSGRWRAGRRRRPGRTPPTRTTCASRRTANPDDGDDLLARRQLPARGRRARDRRQLVPRARAVRRQAVGRPDRAQLARGRRRAARRRHAERADLAPLHVRRLRRDRDRRRLEHLPDRRAPDARPRRGRCWPASAASTSCSPGGDADGAPAHDRRTPPTTG